MKILQRLIKSLELYFGLIIKMNKGIPVNFKEIKIIKKNRKFGVSQTFFISLYQI